MARPRGAKNKLKDIENVDEKIAAVEAQIENLNADLKAKKAELKVLKKAKIKADLFLAEKKAEEDKVRLLEAFEKSGKTIDEVVDLLQ